MNGPEQGVTRLHLGDMCRAVRRGRGLTASRVADLAGIASSTVFRLENGSVPTAATWQRYLAGLAAAASSQPLGERQLGLLQEARTDFAEAREREEEFAVVDFAASAAARGGALDGMLEELGALGVPGGITDELGFNHAVNWSYLRLFGLDAPGGYLENWYAWHMLGSKIAPDSPFMEAPGSGESATQWVLVYLFLMKRYLFTLQAAATVRRLGALAPTAFPGAWQLALTLMLPYDPDIANRSVLFEGDIALTQGVQIRRVPLVPGGGRSTLLTLGRWEARNAHAQRMFDRLAADPRGREVVLAHDLDVQGTFHVNRWPEVQEAPAADPVRAPSGR